MDPALAYQLCLDLGKRTTGYAAMEFGQLIFYGRISHRFATDAELFRRTLGMLRKLDQRVRESGKEIDCITFEAAEKQAGRAAEVYFTMATAVKVFAEREGMPVYKVYSSSMKKCLTGNGKADKRSVIHHVNKRFGTPFDVEAWPLRDDDMADAIAVGHTAIDLYRRDMLRPSP